MSESNRQADVQRFRILIGSVLCGIFLVVAWVYTYGYPLINPQAAKAYEVKLMLIEAAKEDMENPDSFELVAFEHYPPSSKSTYFQVEMRYRGMANSGREFEKTIKAHGDYAGNKLTIQYMPTGRPD